jgi:fluoride exporter
VSMLVFIGLGGFIGSVTRYLVSGYVQQLTSSINFPYGTLAVNLIGCFAIGFLSQLAEARGLFTSESRAFVFVGILGGFTTFSTFGNETMNFLVDGETLAAFANVAAQIVLGLGAVWLGRALAYLIWR